MPSMTTDEQYVKVLSCIDPVAYIIISVCANMRMCILITSVRHIFFYPISRDYSGPSLGFVPC